MTRRTLPIVVLAVLATGIILVAPAAAFTSITVTEPAAPSYRVDATIPIAWATDVAVSSGQFAVWLVDARSQATCLAVVRAHASSPVYTTSVTLDYPPAGSGYRIRIGYRAGTKLPYTVYGYSSSFQLTAAVTEFPFETLTNAPYPDSVPKGQPHDFRFWVFHPDPSAVVQSAKLVFLNARTQAPVLSVPITGIGTYVIESDDSSWSETVAPNTFHWASCALDPGTYDWHVTVTIGGRQNTMWDDATLTVTRR